MEFGPPSFFLSFPLFRREHKRDLIRPMTFCMPVLSLSLQQVIGTRCMVDWLGCTRPNQPADGRALVFPSVGYRWSWNRDWIVNCCWIVNCRWILDCRRRLFYITLELTVHYTIGFYSQP